MALPDPRLPPPEAVAVEVAACAADPDFTGYPGASEHDIAAAEDALGIRFPDHYRAFLKATNGMSVLRGRTNYFGVGQEAVVDVVDFNRSDGWLSKLPEGWLAPVDVVWIGASRDAGLVGIDRVNNENVTARLLLRHNLFRWGPKGLGLSLTSGMAGMRERGLEAKPKWRRVLKKVGPLALDEGLVWGPGFYLNGDKDLIGMRKTNLTTALRIAADLSADLERLGDDAAIYGMMVPYVDDDGTPRVRWATPGRDPDGPPTAVTIDGHIP